MVGRNKIPIYIMYDRGISEREKRIVLQAINEVLRNGDLQDYFSINVVGKENKVESYLEKAEKRKGMYGFQYNAKNIWRSILTDEENYDKILIIIVSKDLFADNTNFIFGATSPLIYHGNYICIPCGSIISLLRFRLLFRNNPKMYEPSIFILTAHEIGHILGIPNRDYNVEYTLGRHCIRDNCVMGQTNVVRPILRENGKIETKFISIEEISEKVLKRLEKSGSIFCEDCEKDLRISKKVISRFLEKELFI